MPLRPKSLQAEPRIARSQETFSGTVNVADDMKVHVNLPVSDLERSVRFYGTLLRTAPLKHYDDYALFVSEDPGLELALKLEPNPAVDRRTHFGIVAASADDIQAAAARLQDAGFEAELQLNETCCYARQTKVWTKDPDGRNWEIYVVHEETAVRKIPTDGVKLSSAT
jgi:catechol 2,3-dioxygenase-like lactoylglutathione lyase family enzyme